MTLARIGHNAMAWFVKVTYKTKDGGLKTTLFKNENKGMVFRQYHRWERNPERFHTIELFEQHMRMGIYIKPRLHMKAQGYMFDDEIPF